jgi:hypothetical protein
MEIIVGLACLTWYYFNCRRAPHAGLVLAVLPLFFAWRSLWSYFFYFDLIMFAAIILNEYGADKQTVPLTTAARTGSCLESAESGP